MRLVTLRFPFLAILFTAASLHAAPQLWFYQSQNLWVDKNIDVLETLWRRAASAGYTHVLLMDSKFAKLGDMDGRYFRNVDRVKRLAAELKLEIVPALFPVGYSNDILWHDPNLIEAMPVRDASFVVRDGVARLELKPAPLLRGGSLEDLKAWDWNDATVTADAGAALIRDPRSQNARLVQKVKLTPFRQYHLQLRIRTENFRGTPEVKFLAAGQSLNHDYLKAKPTQDWTLHHVVFNSLTNSEAQLYIGCWGGSTGSYWFDDVQLEETAFVNLVRRPGAPLVARRSTEDGKPGEPLKEGTDFEPLTDPLLGSKPWKGAYTVWHEPPALKTKLPNGTRLRVSFHHGVTVNDDQAMICPSEPRTMELLGDQARRMHAAWSARGYMMSHDEIRVFNWCAACQRRGLDAGALLADNARACVQMLREVNPGGRIYVWSDMFDPNHNAKAAYYLVRGDLRGSWEGLDRDVIIVPWYFEKRAESLKWFEDLGHPQLIAGYYDGSVGKVRDWLGTARKHKGVVGVMYTTWRQNYADLESFARHVEAP